MASSSRRPPAARPVWDVWLRRRWQFVRAWRLLAAPLVSDPARDPSLRQRVLSERGETCACCGRSAASSDTPPGLRFEVDHRRPLWASGKDADENAQVLCETCHRFKSRAEAPVRAMSKRWDARLGFARRRPRPVVAVAGVLFLTGMATDRWIWWALAWLSVLWFGPPVWRNVRPWWMGRANSGGGFNRQPDFDRILEERQPGVAGRITRKYWHGRRILFSARYLPMAAMGTYVAGSATHHYGIDVAILAVRILSPV